MALDPRALASRLAGFVHRSHLVKFLIVGGLSFAIDLGLLVLLHEAMDVDLWLATPVAFIASLIFNYFVQRSFTFRARSRKGVSMFRYGLLVVFNIFATDIIVNLFDNLALTYAGGKVVATVSTMAWNFFLYKHWIFRGDPEVHQEDGEFTPAPVEDSERA